ncbi:hypothetical protein BJ912DRAFT_924798 [Pholiota molesta]|nr:hypothetical protein BJ912DRAFT_924798 [Pholiota molesta]
MLNHFILNYMGYSLIQGGAGLTLTLKQQLEMHGPLAINGNVSTEEANCLIDEAIERHYASILYLESQENCLASIELHQASILALKSQRNSLASIARIPPEVLGKVFDFTKAAIEPPLFPLYKMKGAPRWLKMTHVLSLRDVRWDAWRYLEGLLPKSAPQLEYLCLTGSSTDLIIPKRFCAKHQNYDV